MIRTIVYDLDGALYAYIGEFGAENVKPRPLPSMLMLESLQPDPDSVLFLGDNPDKDCRGAYGDGIKCAQIQYDGSG
jgi:hypothetical protein